MRALQTRRGRARTRVCRDAVESARHPGRGRRVGSEADERSHPMGKLTFIAGMAAGYVLGARAGRQRYEQIRAHLGQGVELRAGAEAGVQRQGGRAHQGGPGRRRHGGRRRPRHRREAALEPHRRAEAIETGTTPRAPRTRRRPTGTLADRLRRRPVGRRHVAHRRRRLSPSAQAGSQSGSRAPASSDPPTRGTPATPSAAPPAAPSPAWPVPRAAEPSSRAPRL